MELIAKSEFCCSILLDQKFILTFFSKKTLNFLGLPEVDVWASGVDVTMFGGFFISLFKIS